MRTTADKKPRSYFSDNDSAFSFGTTESSKIHLGDIVQYDEHISIVYSERWGESQYSQTGASYDIIHAFGENYYDEDGNPSTPPMFSRKVLLTSDNVSAPKGFGRTKLW